MQKRLMTKMEAILKMLAGERVLDLEGNILDFEGNLFWVNGKPANINDFSGHGYKLLKD